MYNWNNFFTYSTIYIYSIYVGEENKLKLRLEYLLSIIKEKHDYIARVE